MFFPPSAAPVAPDDRSCNVKVPPAELSPGQKNQHVPMFRIKTCRHYCENSVLQTLSYLNNNKSAALVSKYG